MYQALYRKWRPQRFSDVVGQSHITDTLRRQVSEGRLSHAYLFTGTRGTGKTTCAKILAKAVNCEHPVDGDPCNACDTCRGIDSGSLLDVLELDGASNNGVDNVRALRDEAVYSPAQAKRRVYIIDEVHMITPAAFNALLKILEEPPAHLMFILATTELHKIPATILSRCQRFAFKRILPQDIQGRLSQVAAAEGIDLRPDGAELLSRLSDGALRDALALLDQCAATGGTVDSRQVLDTLGLAGSLQTAQLMEQILRRDAGAALTQLHQLYNGGKEIGAILNELSTLSRDLLILMTAPQGGAALLSGSYDGNTLNALCRLADPARSIYMTKLLQETVSGLGLSLNRRTDAELCLLRLCDESLSGSLTALAARISRLERGVLQAPGAPQQAPSAAPVPPAVPVPPAAADDRPPLPEEPPEGPSLPETPPAPDRPAPVLDGPVPDTPAPAGPADTKDSGLWDRLIGQYKSRLPAMCRAFLDSARGTLEGDLLQVVCADDMVLHVLQEKAAAALQSVTSEAAGREVRVAFSVGEVAPAPKGSMDDLVGLGSKLDNFTIKGD